MRIESATHGDQVAIRHRSKVKSLNRCVSAIRYREHIRHGAPSDISPFDFFRAVPRSRATGKTCVPFVSLFFFLSLVPVCVFSSRKSGYLPTYLPTGSLFLSLSKRQESKFDVAPRLRDFSRAAIRRRVLYAHKGARGNIFTSRDSVGKSPLCDR